MIKNPLYGNESVQENAINHLKIIQRLKEGVAVLHSSRFAFANPAFMGITGCRLDALIDKELSEPFPGPEQAAILRDHEDVLRSGNNSRPHGLWIETPAGRARIEMTMAPLQISAALDGMEEELSEMDERFMTSARPEEKDEIWTSGREAVNGYVRDVNFSYRKISELTRAFNSAFLTYREESYLDKTILDIFSACRPD